MSYLLEDYKRFQGYVDGWYYFAGDRGQAVTTTTVTTNTIYYSLFYNWVPTTWTKLGMRVATADASGKVRMGIYTHLNGGPDQLILDAGELATSSANTIVENTISQLLQPGLYWLGFVTNSSTHTFSAHNQGSSSPTTIIYEGRFTYNGGFANIFSGSYTYGALPSSAGLTLSSSIGSIRPLIWMRKGV